MPLAERKMKKLLLTCAVLLLIFSGSIQTREIRGKNEDKNEDNNLENLENSEDNNDQGGNTGDNDDQGGRPGDDKGGNKDEIGKIN